MIKVSVIVPFINERPLLSARVNNIFDVQLTMSTLQMQVEVEWIFVDGGSTDGGDAYLKKLGFNVISAPLGRASQMNAGAELATGQWLVFLHADTKINKNFFHVFTHISQKNNWGYSPIKLNSKKKTFRLIEKSIDLRSKFLRYVCGDQTLFLRKDLFDSGYKYADLALMEDVELSKRLFKHSKPYICPAPVLSSARKWLKHGVIRTVFRMWFIQLAYRLRVDPDKLHVWYYKDELPKDTGANNAQTNTKPNVVIIAQFAKAPIHNLVKTRLASALSPKARVELHKKMVIRVLKNTLSSKVAATRNAKETKPGSKDVPMFGKDSILMHQLWVTAAHPFFSQIQKKTTTSLRLQKGKTLGDRLTDCAKRSLAICDAVILMGSDCLEIDSSIIDKVVHQLNHNDIVSVPATDGGFVLLAMRRWSEGVFRDVQWGQTSVYKQLKENITHHQLSLHELAPLSDIDRPEDLSRLPESIRPTAG